MNCEEYRTQLTGQWGDGGAEEVRLHLAHCPSCAQYYRDLRLVKAGLYLLKNEAEPAPSLGFAERLVRQLGDLSKAPSVAEFFERVGRRFVYTALVLTSLALLALALPATGPVRGLTVADIQTTTQEALLAYSDPIGESNVQESPDLAPSEAPAPTGSNEGK